MKNIILVFVLITLAGCATPNPLRAPVSGLIKKDGLIDTMQLSVNRDDLLTKKQKNIINYKADFFKDYANKALEQ